MNLKIFAGFITFAIFELVTPISVPSLYPDDIASKTSILSVDSDGNLVLERLTGSQSEAPKYLNPPAVDIQENRGDSPSVIYKMLAEDKIEPRVDYLKIPKNFTRPTSKFAGRAALTGPAVIEVVIVVDKEFGDVFQQNYYKVVDYLTMYFWDVSMRYKSLWSVDISIRSKEAQPFIENARAGDGRTEHGRTLSLFNPWIYQQRSWLVRHDMAVLITNANTEWGGGLAWVGGACGVDTTNGFDYGTVVWSDNGDFRSVTVATHEMAHNVGAPHDDDVNSKCPGPYGFIMSGGDENRRYFFQRCSDAAISSYVNSDQAACLRRFDGYETTPMDRYFSNPKAGTMQDMCKLAWGDSTAWVDEADKFNCKKLYCKRWDTTNPNLIWTRSIAPIDNIQCGNGGRCFRGRCRPESRLLKNEAGGFCLNTNSRFGFSVPAQMFACPSSKDKTPLDTLEVINGPSGILLATPFLHDENKESGDRCFYTGSNDGDWLWTDRCSTDNPWQAWQLRPVNGNQNRLQLVHVMTGRCASVISNASNSNVKSTACTADATMIWSWVDGA